MRHPPEQQLYGAHVSRDHYHEGGEPCLWRVDAPRHLRTQCWSKQRAWGGKYIITRIHACQQTLDAIDGVEGGTQAKFVPATVVASGQNSPPDRWH
jgi:hypothetical protein